MKKIFKIFLVFIVLYLILGVSMATLDLINSLNFHNPISIKSYLGEVFMGPGCTAYVLITGERN